ncbi:MAG: tyrosine-type recombinase/integrase [Terriglobia bacterium]
MLTTQVTLVMGMKAFKVRRKGQEYFRVDLPKDLFAEGKRRSTMAGTKREALEKAQLLIQQQKKGLKIDEARSPLSEFLDQFLEFYRSEGGVAPRTWQDYRYQIEHNISPAIGSIVLSELKPRHVDLWMKSLRDRGLGNRSVEYAQAVLRRSLQFAVEWEILDRNPAAARFRAAKRKRATSGGPKRIQFLNPKEAQRFLSVIEGTSSQAIFTVALTTGLRPEELYGLRWKDVDLDAGRLTVNQVLSKTRRKKGEQIPRFFFGPPKTEKSRRTIDFPDFVRGVLLDHDHRLKETRILAGTKWQENGLVFPSEIGTPAEERNVLRRFQKICKENDLPRLRVYDLRHSHASLLINEGVHPKKISERLGHSSIKLTMDTYGHLFEGSDRDSADKMEKMFGPTKSASAKPQTQLALVPKKAS